MKQLSRWGWLFYRRVKTQKSFCRAMNRAVHAHIKSIMPENPKPDDPIFLGGGARPNARFKTLCQLAGIAWKLPSEYRPILLNQTERRVDVQMDQNLLVRRTG